MIIFTIITAGGLLLNILFCIHTQEIIMLKFYIHRGFYVNFN